MKICIDLSMSTVKVCRHCLILRFLRLNGLANLQTDEQEMIPSAVCMPCFNRHR